MLLLMSRPAKGLGSCCVLRAPQKLLHLGLGPPQKVSERCLGCGAAIAVSRLAIEAD